MDKIGHNINMLKNPIDKLSHQHILGLGIGLYIIILTAISWYKYFMLGYNGLDLAIFDNVFFNAISGNGFWSSIQGHHYFADHFAPLLALLLPFYALWPSPLNLLFLQSLLLGLSALPVYLLGKKIINQKWGTALALVWLINPLLWNINLHEWHILPFAIPLLLLAYYFYLQNNFKYFLLLLIASMLIREDVVVVTFMFSLLALLDKKEKKWIIAPAALSILYFIFTMAIISYLRPGGSRFLIYYQWILTSSPWQIVTHILNLSNWEMALGLLLSFLFLPLFSPRYLILSLGILAQIILVAGGSGSVITDTHYSSLFIPGLIISSIWSVKKIKNGQTKKISKIIKFDPTLSKAIILVCVLYLWLVLGPGYGIAARLASPQVIKTDVSKVVNIPPSATIAASYVYLPLFSTRENIYPLHYLLTGYQQFSLEPFPYQLPDYIILDLEDLIAFEVQFKNTYYFSDFYPQGYKNLEKLLRQGYELTTFNHQFAIWQKNKLWQDKYFEDADIDASTDQSPQFTFENLALIDWQWDQNLLKVAWKKQGAITDNFFLKISSDNFSYIRPLTLFIPTSLWQNNQLYQSVIFIPPNKKNIDITIGTISGRVEIDNWRGIKINYTFTDKSPPFSLSKPNSILPDK